MQIVDETAVHNDERVLDDVRLAVVVEIIERVRMARTTAESGLFGIP